ncbi:MAG TPA: DUF1003 domain-containing protein [Vicinamibacterales bacterium]|nr:DUF1003 domain-containing protein [Vicinamibacterales bacterium]
METLVIDVSRLNAIERRIVERFVKRQRVMPPTDAGTVASFGDRVADVVTAFGGSWPFVAMTVVFVTGWMIVNALMSKAFDAYPFILLNLVLAVMTVLQAPFIMMSQNRQAARDRLEAQHDYEVNTKAELEVAALSAKLDDIRDTQWAELIKTQQQQLELLIGLASRRADC